MPENKLLPNLLPQTRKELIGLAVTGLAVISAVAAIEVARIWADFLWLLRTACFPPAP